MSVVYPNTPPNPKPRHLHPTGVMRGLKNAQLTNIPLFLSLGRASHPRHPPPNGDRRRHSPFGGKKTPAREGFLGDKIQSCDDGIGGGREKSVCPLAYPIRAGAPTSVFVQKKGRRRRNKTLLLRSPSVLPERRRRRTRRPWHPLKRKEEEEGPALVLGAMTKTQKRAPASSDRPTPMDRSYLPSTPT